MFIKIISFVPVVSEAFLSGRRIFDGGGETRLVFCIYPAIFLLKCVCVLTGFIKAFNGSRFLFNRLLMLFKCWLLRIKLLMLIYLEERKLEQSFQRLSIISHQQKM